MKLHERDLISWTELIVAYAKDMESAGELFDQLPLKNMVAWTAMVTGYAQNANPRVALELFERMQNEGVKTDEVTLVGVISACAQLGAAKYSKWIRDIVENLGTDPTRCVVVGSALIDMYSKCGNVEDAYKFFEAMEERNVYSYSSMISGFAMHGCAYAALELFREMRWNDVSMVKKLMREEGLRKNPGCSWMEGKKGVIEEFFARDMTHPRSGEMKQVLEHLRNRLKAIGYEPNMNSVAYDVNDEEKRRILIIHSEKLALAFGLLGINADCLVRFMRNIIICEDWHSFMCGVSQVTGRVIIVRDNLRFTISMMESAPLVTFGDSVPRVHIS
ncbi:putative dimethyladenosine transferase-like [Hibiscus syriacus]|uniref:Dimethyladenosine transferase-like n=1 Tax=Hibiscus syriacus TaxID=106335 RepID=A0A6A3BF61_HIBSY|nr:putative dimethyladenosine transferase-like [Hibiscus syriacus]